MTIFDSQEELRFKILELVINKNGGDHSKKDNVEEAKLYLNFIEGNKEKEK